MSHDREGFAIPFSDDDVIIECGACDPDHGEPAEWPAWTDAARWEPSQEDWEDYRQWCEHVDRLDAIRRMEDSEWEKRMRFGE
jgi:hypothetical protein